MLQKSVRIRTAQSLSSGDQTAVRRGSNSRGIALIVILSALMLAGCAKNDPVAGLNELPHDDAARLQLVSNAPLLATKIQQTKPAPPAAPPPAPLCPQDLTRTFYDAQILTPITVCSRTDLLAHDTLMFRTVTSITTHKLTDPGIFKRPENSFLQPPFLCSTSNGPWSARITSERGCIGTCSPVNDLIVVGVPNTVEFVWRGNPLESQPGFEFVETPKQTDEEDFGPCNSGPGGLRLKQVSVQKR